MVILPRRQHIVFQQAHSHVRVFLGLYLQMQDAYLFSFVYLQQGISIDMLTLQFNVLGTFLTDSQPVGRAYE